MSAIKFSHLLTLLGLFSLVACVSKPAPDTTEHSLVGVAAKPDIQTAPSLTNKLESGLSSEVANDEHYRQATEQPVDTVRLTELQLQQFQQARVLWQQGQSNDALALLQSLPPNTAVLYNQVLILRHTAQHQQADALLQSLAQQKYPAAFNLLGIEARQRGDFEQAAHFYQQALQYQADFAEAELNLAMLYELYLWQPAQALPHYQRYQQLTADPQAEGWISILQQQLEAKNHE